MDHPIHNHVRDLSIGFGMNYLLLSVDRIFVRERVKKVGDPPRVIKEHESVDMLCWDAEGTRVLCKLVTDKAVDVHGQILKPKRTYMFTRYLVTSPGHDVHPEFHIRLDELTSVDLIVEPFIDRVYNLRSPSDIPAYRSFAGSLYDVCGFVDHCSEASFCHYENAVTQECLVLMSSKLKGLESGVKDSIIVHLRGDWVEAESAVIRDRVHKSLTKPFILIKHLKLGRPTFTGRPVLHSVFHATKVVCDIEIQDVFEKRAELICP